MPEDYKSTPALRWFAEDRVRDTPDSGPAPCDTVGLKGLQTASGKIEFVSSSLTRLEKTGTIDPERPALGAQYLDSWEGHKTKELVAKYPLQMISPHPRWSFHTLADGKRELAAERGKRPPDAQGGWPLLLDNADEPR